MVTQSSFSILGAEGKSLTVAIRGLVLYLISYIPMQFGWNAIVT